MSTEPRRFDADLVDFHGGPLDGERHWIGLHLLRLLFTHRMDSYHVYNLMGGPLRMVYGGTAPASAYPDDEVWTL